jgi:parallel beta-helix repeat protein
MITAAKKAQRVLILAALMICLSAGFARAAERHVAAGGRDGNAGSLSAPWATLQHAVERVQPGDVIIVHQGAYAGCRITRSGREDAWITLQAATGEKVIIDRPGPNNKHRSNVELETWDGDGTVSYWIIQGFEVAYGPWAGIDIRGQEASFNHHINLAGNEVHHSGQTGIFVAFSNDLRVEANHSHQNGEHGIYISNSSDRPTILDNTCRDNYACGIHMNGDASMGGDGIISGALIQGNTIYGNGRGGGAGINMDGVVESRVLANTIFDNRAGGITLYAIDAAQASRDVHLEDNTVRMPAGSRWAVNISNDTCRNITMLRNTFYHADRRRGAVRIPTPGLPGLVSDHNKVTDRFSINGGGGIISLGQWQSHGWDLNSRLVTEADLN